jgi:hypothetical protein
MQKFLRISKPFGILKLSNVSEDSSQKEIIGIAITNSYTSWNGNAKDSSVA